MKKTITMVLIALHFAKMSVEKLIPFAGGIKTNAGSDKQIKIDPVKLLLWMVRLLI